MLIAAEQALAATQATAKTLRESRARNEELARSEQHARELSTYLENHYIEAEKRLSDSESRLKEIRAKMLPSGPDLANIEKEIDVSLSLDEFKQHCSTFLEQSRAAHRDTQSRLTDFTKQRDQALGLAQQLRDIAVQLLSQAEKRDVCPLCHTEFFEGELSKRIYQDIDSLLEAESTKLRDLHREAEASLAKANEHSAISERLMNVAAQNALPQDVGISSVIELLRSLQDQEADLQKEVASAREACQELRSKGLAIDRFEELMGAVWGNNATASPSIDQLNMLRKQLADERALLSREADKLEVELKEQNQQVAGLLGIEGSSLKDNKEALSKRKEQRDIVVSLLKKMDDNEAMKVCSEDIALAELLTTVRVIRKLLTDLQTATANEQQAVTLASESAKRKEEISRQLDGMEPRIKRCREAEEVFRTILEEHSLAGAMEEALQLNKAAIEEIFRRIHSPAEFSGLRDMTTLIRKDGQEAKLHQISTGQRAAYALSLFLAQNAQLRSAPQLILIDDPIAHVDDLNCLSFLNYLREVSLSGDRQIVFATANDKLASLFQRKFDFLGEEHFKRHDMSR